MQGPIRFPQLDWTMVRSAVLKNRPASQQLDVGLCSHTKHSLMVAREDLAKFMFEQIENRHALEVSTRR
ncbi:NAD(P)H-binding protein [Burkholderia cepacia]|uniref:NAD(P)H-binding protein n=1 Tax=Burkholderia TaxID=32008 RepID=UPI003BF4B71C